MTYYEQLKDPRWDKHCLDLIQSRGWKCCHCDKETRKLQVHHGAYLKGVALWDYPPEMLHVLCAGCHEETTRDIELFMRWFGQLRPGEVSGLAYVLPKFYSEFQIKTGSRMFSVMWMLLSSTEDCDCDFADEIIAKLNLSARRSWRKTGYQEGLEQSEFSRKPEKEGTI